MNKELGLQLIDSLELIIQNDHSPEEKAFSLYLLLNIIAEEATIDENLSFTSLFSRLSYLANARQISKKDIYYIHLFRIYNERNKVTNINAQKLNELGKIVLHNLINDLWELDLQIQTASDELMSYFEKDKPPVQSFYHLIEALVIQINYDKKQLIFLFDGAPGEKCTAEFDIPHINEPFTQNILSLEKIYQLPLHINFIDCEHLEDGTFRPKAFVIKPDYLVDVTAIATNSSSKQNDIWLYALQKMLPKPSSKYILIGNVANYFLDALIANPKIDLNTLYKSLFKLYPLEFALYDNQEINDIVADINLHFTNLKRVVEEEFINKGFRLDQVYLEPSFYCRDYGIQGRLDLFHIDKKNNNADIVELKSGKPFMPNSYGINSSHYIQTLLYDMMITSAYQGKISPQNYILYSKLDSLNLKYAPRLKSQQFEILKIRNELVAIDHAMARSPEMVKRITSHLTLENFIGLKGFLKGDLKKFEDIYQFSSDLEKAYFSNYISFIAREAILSKTGEHGVSKSNGLSALWMDTLKEKEERYSIINHLHIIDNKSSDDDPIIVFKRSDLTAQLNNFRKGDIGVLYPHHHNERNILRHQIFKCSILEMNDEQVVVRLRSPQYNQSVFKENEFWNIEQDVLSSSFNHMYRNLLEFLSAPTIKKEVILGLVRPKNHEQMLDIQLDTQMTAEQKSIVYKAMNTKDYFLIWGPPGTGKTSVVLKNLVRSIHKYTDEKILLLAYTNRAVDEICDALEAANLGDHFIRIGSRFSVGNAYTDHLLQSKMNEIETRKGIHNLLAKNRIYVSTVSSIIGKKELFEIVKINTVIIDEASQILEPMLVGLITKFDRFIMIGDHKQLPAVVTQNEKNSILKNDELNNAGFVDMSVSLFERLYMQCKEKNWDNAWSVLTQQGRMHADLMHFVNTNFYEGKLKHIPGIKRLVQPMQYKSRNLLEQALATERLIYINTETDPEFNWKTNENEAQVASEICTAIHALYSHNMKTIDANTLGIITPYRAQIALIKSKISNQNITIDTVERYQGGARDIIILSLCTNRISQLSSLVSLSTEGIDRKLNVALTRAKEQIIIIGNQSILSQNETYHKLIQQCYELHLEQ